MNGDLAEVEWGQSTCPAAYWKNWPSLHAHEKHPGAGSRKGPPLSPAQIEKRIRYVNENYEVIDWEIGRGKAQVTCKNKDSHTTDTGDGQTIIFIGSDDMGAVSYHCSHVHCADFNKEERERLWEGFIQIETFLTPSGTEELNAMLERLFGAMADLRCFYRRSENPPFKLCYWRVGMSNVLDISKGNLGNILGQEKINFTKRTAKGLLPTIPVKEFATSILEAHQAAILPQVTQIVSSALLVKTETGAEIIGETYCASLKTIVLGKTTELPQKSFDQGWELLKELQDYWIWKEPADRARGLAELLTPALFQGGFIQRPIPAFLLTADDFAAGKTAWQEDVACIYGHILESNNYSKLNIGSLEEKLQTARFYGDPFFFIDELDGAIKSITINGYITGASEGRARTLYEGFVKVSERLLILLAGVKGFTIEEQLASRALIIQIIKPASNTNWYTPGGVYLKTHIEEHTKDYLASIYAVIKEWADRGAAEDTQISWRFPEWEKIVNGILNLVSYPRATDGLESLQNEISNPAQFWLGPFAKTLEESGICYCGEGVGKLCSLVTLTRICNSSGLEVPGVNPLLREGVSNHIKARRIGEIISSLPRRGEANGREPVYRLGEFYLAQYLLPEGHKRKKFYLFSTTPRLPAAEQTSKYQPEDTSDYAV